MVGPHQSLGSPIHLLLARNGTDPSCQLPVEAIFTSRVNRSGNTKSSSTDCDHHSHGPSCLMELFHLNQTHFWQTWLSCLANTLCLKIQLSRKMFFVNSSCVSVLLQHSSKESMQSEEGLHTSSPGETATAIPVQQCSEQGSDQGLNLLF